MFLRPLVQPFGAVVDIAIKKAAMIGVEHDLPDGRTRTFGHNAVRHAFAFGHPGSW